MHVVEGEVHIYQADLDEPGRAEAVSEQEVLQAEAFATAELRARFLRSRSLLRLVLSRYAGAAPADLRFDRTCPVCGGDHGKPRLDRAVHGRSAPEFSVSRSSGRFVMAVAADAVGVDVETDRNLDYASVAMRLFGPEEAGRIRAVSRVDRASAFLDLWVRKEALGKAAGAGLSPTVLATNVEPAAGIVTLEGHGEWRLMDVPMAGPFKAAAAVRPSVRASRVAEVKDLLEAAVS